MDQIEKDYINNFLKKDKSFKNKESFLSLLLQPFGKKYSEQECRKIWESGNRSGFEQGIYYGSPKSQKIQLINNMENENHNKFYKKFLNLCEDHNVRIEYHPNDGLVFRNYVNKSNN